MLTAWRTLTILLVALVQGLAFAHLLERPAKLMYDANLYLTLQKTLYVQWGPPNVGGLVEPAAIVATLVLAYLIRGNRRALACAIGAAIALLAAFPAAFFLLVAPANDVFLNAAPGVVPANWMAMRDQWEMGHAVRFAMQFAALILLVVPLVLESRALHPPNP